MAKKKTAQAGRAWSVVRLAFIWARRGGMFKRGFMVDVIPNYLKSLRAATRESIGYAEREFSFDETPIFHFKLRKTGSMRFKYLPSIPCINPAAVDVEDDCYSYRHCNARNSYFRRSVDEDDNDYGAGAGSSSRGCSAECWEEEYYCQEPEPEGDPGIDDKAEEFIERFYRQVKMQRQVSYLQYNEMLMRGAS